MNDYEGLLNNAFAYQPKNKGVKAPKKYIPKAEQEAQAKLNAQALIQPPIEEPQPLTTIDNSAFIQASVWGQGNLPPQTSKGAITKTAGQGLATNMKNESGWGDV